MWPFPLPNMPFYRIQRIVWWYIRYFVPSDDLFHVSFLGVWWSKEARSHRCVPFSFCCNTRYAHLYLLKRSWYARVEDGDGWQYGWGCGGCCWEPRRWGRAEPCLLVTHLTASCLRDHYGSHARRFCESSREAIGIQELLWWALQGRWFPAWFKWINWMVGLVTRWLEKKALPLWLEECPQMSFVPSWWIPVNWLRKLIIGRCSWAFEV